MYEPRSNICCQSWTCENQSYSDLCRETWTPPKQRNLTEPSHCNTCSQGFGSLKCKRSNAITSSAVAKFNGNATFASSRISRSERFNFGLASPHSFQNSALRHASSVGSSCCFDEFHSEICYGRPAMPAKAGGSKAAQRLGPAMPRRVATH